MADDRDTSQQTEEPTQKRLDEAHEHGDVVKSTEVHDIRASVRRHTRHRHVRQVARPWVSRASVPHVPRTARSDRASDPARSDGDDARYPAAQLGLVLGRLSRDDGRRAGRPSLQHRPVFTFDRIKPDFSKLSPLTGFKRMFGVEGWINLLKGLLKIAVVGVGGLDPALA